MCIGPMNDCIGIAKAFQESIPGRDVAYLVFVQRIVHHHEICVDRFAPGDFANAQRVKGRKTVRADLQARPYFPQSRGLLQHLHVKALARQCQGCRQSADTTTGHDHRQRIFCFLIHECPLLFLICRNFRRY